MNPFQEHDANQLEYEAELAQPINGVVGNTIQFPLDNKGNVIPTTATMPATISHFVMKDLLVDGGISPQLVGQAIIRKAVVPANTHFRRGFLVIANQVGGSSRGCVISDVEDTFTEWRLNLWDKSERA